MWFAIDLHIENDHEMPGLAVAGVDESSRADTTGIDVEPLRGVSLHAVVIDHPGHDLVPFVLVVIGDEEEGFDGRGQQAAQIEREAAEKGRVIDFFRPLGRDNLVEPLEDLPIGWVGRLQDGGLCRRRRFFAASIGIGRNKAEAQAARKGGQSQDGHRDRLQFGEKHHPHHPFGKLDGVCGHESRNPPRSGDHFRGPRHAIEPAAYATAAAVPCMESSPASAPPESVTPRRVSRVARVRRAEASRVARVAGGTPSCFATSRCGRPSRSHRTTGRRSLSGRPGEFLVDHRLKVGPLGRGRVGNGGSGMTSTCFSRDRRRARTIRAFIAVRYATPYSQLPTCSRGSTAAARRASTRKTAWNASSAMA